VRQGGKRLKKQKEGPGAGFALALFALLLGCILALVVLGGGLYERLARSQQENGAARTAAGYLTTRVRAADREGAVRLEEGPQGPVLMLAEAPEEGGYELRIYLYEGWLVEDYAPAGSAFAPEQAQLVAQSSRFEPEFAAPGLLRIETGQGDALIALRSGEGRRAA